MDPLYAGVFIRRAVRFHVSYHEHSQTEKIIPIGVGDNRQD